jgi:hypothetical protein
MSESHPTTNSTTIPHAGCKTPGECRKEQICLDGWRCCTQQSCDGYHFANGMKVYHSWEAYYDV